MKAFDDFSCNRCHDRDGFTLIEVLISIVVLSVAFLGLSAMTIGTIRGLSFSDNQTTSTTLARMRMEQIKNATYSTVTSENYPLEAYNTIAGYEQFQRAVVITDNAPDTNTKTITVTVSWNDKGGNTRNVSISTIITQ